MRLPTQIRFTMYLYHRKDIFMKTLLRKIDRLLLSLVGIALILVSIVFQDIEYIYVPLAIIGLVICILSSPILKAKEEKERNDNAELSEK